MQYTNSLIFIVSNIKNSISRIMVLYGIITFLKCDHTILYQVLSQLHFTWRDKQPALSPKNLM